MTNLNDSIKDRTLTMYYQLLELCLKKEVKIKFTYHVVNYIIHSKEAEVHKMYRELAEITDMVHMDKSLIQITILNP